MSIEVRVDSNTGILHHNILNIKIAIICLHHLQDTIKRYNRKIKIRIKVAVGLIKLKITENKFKILQISTIFLSRIKLTNLLTKEAKALNRNKLITKGNKKKEMLDLNFLRD